MKGFLVLLLLLLCGQSKTVYMTVMYCPTYFSSAGAVVAVDTETNATSIVGKFKWPIGDQDECSLLVSPAVSFDRPSGRVWLDFGSDFGKNLAVDLKTATVAATITPNDPFFIQFMSFYVGDNSAFLRGIHPTVTQDGLCNDGCYQMETLLADGRNQTAPNLLLYKAVMDDTDFFRDPAGLYYAQMSYDLRNESARCQAPERSSLCLVAIDETDGHIVRSTYTPYTVYKYAHASADPSNVLTFAENVSQSCYRNSTESSYAFARVNLTSAAVSLTACLDVDIVMDEWISAFSADGTEFATASGDASSGQGQLLVAEVASGAVKLNLDTNDIGKTLGSASGLFLVLSIDYLD